jgi:hypothetical protein
LNFFLEYTARTRLKSGASPLKTPKDRGVAHMGKMNGELAEGMISPPGREGPSNSLADGLAQSAENSKDVPPVPGGPECFHLNSYGGMYNRVMKIYQMTMPSQY